jgi:hypothetical protein|tara:strand:- start:350 stop:571 length:222 start_codon:yes stop_codon:yes gene_type:complete
MEYHIVSYTNRGRKMEQDRKEYRRTTLRSKKNGKDKDYSVDKKDNNKIQKAFKHKKRELKEEEMWEQWEDEIY